MFLTMLLLTTAGPCVNAQKREIGQARTYIKSGKNLDKAEESMRMLLTDSVNIGNIKIYTTLAEAVKKQYEQVNERVYLRLPYDTVVFFNTTKKMFDAYEKLDSALVKYGNRQDGNDKTRAKNAEYLSAYRVNLYNGGLFLLKRNDFRKALSMFDAYLDCHSQPLFSAYGAIEDDHLAPLAASRSLYCGYKMQDYGEVLRNRELAMKDTQRLELTMQCLSETYSFMNDTTGYVSMLQEGFGKFPNSSYFFTHLIDHYNGVSDFKSALSVADAALEHDSCGTLYLYAKSNIMLNMGRYDECIELCDRIIAINDSIPDAYYNAGIAYINNALTMEKMRGGSKKKQQIRSLYSKSLSYMEKYRALSPADKDKWGAALYNIYLKLNMGKEFEEIDAILRQP